ncbi:epoxyqueuosine reductase QueH [Ruminococcus sp. OA3]|uniref:epoxyqueuosine reductase QueH n=1 Tax=Ruminococcus sp. OA3 TaxID=2914164 RepID=UPI001F05DC5A|nr:epoxyqueuosine reductase QueH [Ruminococcus sp. OA3]MCH1983199.1 epoxyqueuosine reductase QueH [Ruminococcus sp. OA3]
MKQNYQKQLDELITEQGERVPKLLLHSCCAPCSSYVLEYLSQHFSITVFYYNPNIYPEEEYRKRVKEQQEFIKRLNVKNPVGFLEGKFEPEEFYKTAAGMETLPERGERCYYCYRLRLHKTAQIASENGFEYFCSTLSISPLKNAEWLNEIGGELETVCGVKWLPSDFKKKEGYKRSVELSEKYGLYRQDYCGCIFSKKQRESEKKKNNTCHGK